MSAVETQPIASDACHDTSIQVGFDTLSEGCRLQHSFRGLLLRMSVRQCEGCTGIDGVERGNLKGCLARRDAENQSVRHQVCKRLELTRHWTELNNRQIQKRQGLQGRFRLIVTSLR